MSEIRSSNIRFHLDNEMQRRAWEYLQKAAPGRRISYGALISEALAEYAERQERLQDDPYLETREREEQFVRQIVEEVRLALEKSLPVFLAGYRAGAGFTDAPALPAAEPSAQPETEDIDWNFVGG